MAKPKSDESDDCVTGGRGAEMSGSETMRVSVEQSAEVGKQDLNWVRMQGGLSEKEEPLNLVRMRVCETTNIDTRAAINEPTEYFAIFDKMVTKSNSPKRVEKEPVCETTDIDTRAAIIKPTEYFAIFDKMVKKSNSPKRVEKEPEEPEVKFVTFETSTYGGKEPTSSVRMPVGTLDLVRMDDKNYRVEKIFANAKIDKEGGGT